MGRQLELLEVNYLTRHNEPAEQVSNTGVGAGEFLSYSSFNNSPKAVDRVQHCLAIALMNEKSGATQLLHVSPRPGKVALGHSDSRKNKSYFKNRIRKATHSFRWSRGPKTAIVLGGVDRSMSLGIDLGTSCLTQSDIYHATLQVVAGALSSVNIEIGPSNSSSSRMMWVALLSLPQSFQIQYLNTLAFNAAVPQDY